MHPIEIAFFVLFFAGLLYYGYKRIAQKKKEVFEERDN